MNINLSLITGVDIPFPQLGIAIHQPTIREYSYCFSEEEDLFRASRLLCINKEMILNGENITLTNFDLLIKTIFRKEKTQDLKNQIINLLQLLFPDYKIFLTQKSISLQKDNNIVVLDSSNYEDFQKIISQILCTDNDSSSDGNVPQKYNPANKQAQAIVDKIYKAREKIDKQKKFVQTGTFLDKYLSILAIGQKIDLNLLTELTLYQLFDLFKRYNLYTAWEIDLRIKLAGGTTKGTTEQVDWTKSFH